jgi:hypothetical protein
MFKPSLSAAAAVMFASGAFAGPTFRTVAVSGAQAPGQAQGVLFSFLSDPRINDAAAVMFWADLIGPGVSSANEGSIWSDRSGSLVMLLQEGQNTGQSPTSVWAAIPRPAFNSAGRLGLTGTLSDPVDPNQTVNMGIYAEDVTAALVKIAREREPLPPPAASGNWTNLPVTNLSDGGAVAFHANRGIGIWTAAPGQTPGRVIQTGDIPPGASGLFLDFIDMPAQSGLLVFRGSLRDVPAAGAEPVGWGLWTADGTNLVNIAKTDTLAPGTDAGFTALALQPTVNAQGQAAFWGRVGGLGVGAMNDEGIWSAQGQVVNLRIREGTPAADCEPGVMYGAIAEHPALNDSGVMSFTAHLTGAGVTTTNNSGVWKLGGKSIQLLAREGSQVPRLPQGVEFAGFSEPAVNSAGQVAFLARLRGPGVTTSNSQAMFVTDRAGLVYPLVRTGDAFSVGGQPRVIDEIVFDSEASGSGHAQFADTAAGGTAIFKLVFRDPVLPPAQAFSSGIFTGSLWCLIDVDGSGALNINDFVAFQNAFAAGDLRACDFLANGALDINDFIGFLNAYAAGCQ